MGVLSVFAEQIQPLQDRLGTPATIAVGAIAVVVLSVVLNVLQQLLFKDKSKPPVVFHFFPFLGSTIFYGVDPYAFFFACQKKYGDVFTFILLGRKMTVCLGPQGNDFVLNGKLAEVSAEEAYSHLTTPVFGEGVAYDVPNATLMEQKKFMKYGLTTEQFRSYVPLIVEQVEDYLKKSKYFKGSQGQAPLLEVIPEITIFTASRSLQGKEVRDGLDGRFATLMHHLDVSFNPMNFLFPWIPWPSNRRRDYAQREMARFYMSVIEKRRAQKIDPNQEKTDMIWNLMDRKYKDGRPVSDREVAHMMIALLMAGQHTSMGTITWLILSLADKPEIVEELYQEQQRVFGKELRPLDYDKFNELTLLQNVIREVLRMHPPIHSIMRKVKSPMQVPNSNMVIPSSHFLLASPGASSIDSTYFPNPMEFDPHRWDNRASEEEGEKFDFGYGMVSKGTASPYLPFGAGRHRCIGEQFANVQLCTIVSILVREFTMSLPDGKMPPIDYTSMIALALAPAMINWKRRSP